MKKYWECNWDTEPVADLLHSDFEAIRRAVYGVAPRATLWIFDPRELPELVNSGERMYDFGVTGRIGVAIDIGRKLIPSECVALQEAFGRCNFPFGITGYDPHMNDTEGA